MTLRGAAQVVGIALACAGVAGGFLWYDANRLTRRYCIQSHVEEDTCMSMMTLDPKQPASSMPYYYPCDRRVCDAFVCERRVTRNQPWEEVTCP